MKNKENSIEKKKINEELSKGQMTFIFVIIAIALLLWITFNILDGLWLLVLALILILIIITYTLKFLKKYYPTTFPGRFAIKLLRIIKEFIQDLIPFV